MANLTQDVRCTSVMDIDDTCHMVEVYVSLGVASMFLYTTTDDHGETNEWGLQNTLRIMALPVCDRDVSLGRSQDIAEAGRGATDGVDGGTATLLVASVDGTVIEGTAGRDSGGLPPEDAETLLRGEDGMKTELSFIDDQFGHTTITQEGRLLAREAKLEDIRELHNTIWSKVDKRNELGGEKGADCRGIVNVVGDTLKGMQRLLQKADESGEYESPLEALLEVLMLLLCKKGGNLDDIIPNTVQQMIREEAQTDSQRDAQVQALWWCCHRMVRVLTTVFVSFGVGSHNAVAALILHGGMTTGWSKHQQAVLKFDYGTREATNILGGKTVTRVHSPMGVCGLIWAVRSLHMKSVETSEKERATHAHYEDIHKTIGLLQKCSGKNLL